MIQCKNVEIAHDEYDNIDKYSDLGGITWYFRECSYRVSPIEQPKQTTIQYTDIDGEAAEITVQHFGKVTIIPKENQQ